MIQFNFKRDEVDICNEYVNTSSYNTKIAKL